MGTLGDTVRQLAIIDGGRGAARLWALVVAAILSGCSGSGTRPLTSKDVQGRWVSAPDDTAGLAEAVLLTFDADGRMRSSSVRGYTFRYDVRGDSVRTVNEHFGLSGATYLIRGDSLIFQSNPHIFNLSGRPRVFLRAR